MATRIVPVLMAVVLGVGWLFFLAHLTNGQGLVAISFDELVLNWIVVLILSCGSYALSPKAGWFALLSWIGAQAAFLTYDGMPKGRSPQMFQPTSFFEAVLLAALIVGWFNWPAIIGATGGFFLGRAVRAKKLRPVAL